MLQLETQGRLLAAKYCLSARFVFPYKRLTSKHYLKIVQLENICHSLVVSLGICVILNQDNQEI